MKLRTALLIALLFDAGFALGSTGARDVDIARELFRASGMEYQLTALAPGAEQHFMTQAQQLPEAMRAEMLAVIRTSFEPVELGNATLSNLQARMDRTKANQALEWLHSTTGQRITKLEEASSEPEAVAALQAYAESLQSAPPDPARVELVQRLDQAARGTELTSEILSTISLAVARAVVSAVPEAGSIDELEAQFEAQQPMIQQTARGMVIVSSLYTYRDLGSAEFTSYIQFLESPAGRWYMQATGDAFLEAMREAADRFATGLASALKKAESQSN